VSGMRVDMGVEPPHNQRLKLTGAAILVSELQRPCRRPRQPSRSFAGKSGVVMSKDALRFVIAAVCALVCIACPITIAWFGETYGFDRLRSDEDFRLWRVYAVEGLFWVALLATIGFIVLARKWWWVAALVALPLLVITGMLSVTCSMWLDGTYF